MNKKDVSGKTLQDIGISVQLIAVFAAVIVSALSSSELVSENIVMTVVAFVAVILAAFRVTGLAIVIAALQTIIFLVYKLYSLFALDKSINTPSYLWVVIPVLAVLGMTMFIKGVNRLQLDNNILSQQVEELIMIDPLTGFYNLRSMYMDIQTQISFAERNEKKICLMILRPRYRRELKDVLKREQYETTIVKLARFIYDTVRLEDRVYSLDGDGTIGVLLTCDRAGARLVEGRIRNKIENEKAFADIAEKPIRMDIQLGCLEYKREYNRDAILFKSQVEEELAYDI